MISKNKDLKTKDDFLQDDKVERNKPNFISFRDWLATTHIGYKRDEGKRLTLKKSDEKAEIYDGNVLLARYEKSGNFFWLGIPTLPYEIFGRAKDIKKTKKEEFRAVTEADFNVEQLIEEERELTEEEINREYLNARGKMASKIRDLFKSSYGEDAKSRFRIGDEDKDIDANEFVQYILENFKQQFNKYGLRIANWVINGLISDKNLTLKRRLIMALDQLVREDDAKYDENFNGLTPKEIMDEYAAAVKAAIRKEKEEINNMPVSNNGYTAYEVKNEKDAQYFAKYQADRDKWCISKGLFNSYVDPLAGKAEVFYVLVKDGYKNMKAPSTNERDAYDDYAKSMIMVSVRQDGSIRTVTSRYNHSVSNPKGRSADQYMNDLELSQLIGKSIYKVCPPLSSPLDLLRDIKTKGLSYLKSESTGFKREIKFYGGFLYVIENNQLMTDTWDSILKFNKMILVKEKPGDLDSNDIGYIMIQKILASEEHMQDDSTEDFFVGMDLNLNIIYGPTKKGDIYEAIKKTRGIIQGGK